MLAISLLQAWPMKDEKKVAAAQARAKKLTPEERSAIGSRAAAVRWNIPRAEYTGKFKIGDKSFPCSVLSDGTRILTQTDFMEGMGMYYSGWVAQKQSQDNSSAEIPHFLAFKALEPFIDKHLGDLQSITLSYKTERGNTARGIKAEIIPKICEIWIDADEQGKLGKRQKQIAQSAKLLMRSLAHTGIIALVDEVTGYQNVRARHALEEILNKFISEELRKWAKTFPDEFYKEMFRLKEWPYNPSSIDKRPGVVGKYTNNLVYERLAPGVLDELRKKNPKNSKGHRRHKHFQYLTEDIGDPRLREHLASVIVLMRASDNWDQFMRSMNRALPRYEDTIELMLEEN